MGYLQSSINFGLLGAFAVNLLINDFTVHVGPLNAPLMYVATMLDLLSFEPQLFTL